MSEGMDTEAMTDTVEQCLSGESGFMMPQVGFKLTALSDLGEIYIRTPGGDHFRMVVEPVAASDIEGWGIEFDD